MRTIRLFKILDWLRSQKYPISAEKLADELQVSVRTIYRDMATLQTMGAPVRGEGGVGYQIENGYFLPPLQFDADELDAIVLGIRMVSARGDGALGEAAVRAMGKIDAVLSGERETSDRPLLAVANSNSKSSEQFISPLRTAIRERQKVEIFYVDQENRESVRVVRPLGLTAFATVWLLTAWCEKRNAFRDFRMDRIKTAQVMSDTFLRERGKEFSDYLKLL